MEVSSDEDSSVISDGSSSCVEAIDRDLEIANIFTDMGLPSFNSIGANFQTVQTEPNGNCGYEACIIGLIRANIPILEGAGEVSINNF